MICIFPRGGVIDGDLTVKGDLTVDDSLTVDGRTYGINKVLWNGAFYMNSDHTVNLSEPVSKQPHGIVLVWCYYANNTAYPNLGVTTFFVPKSYVARNNSFQLSCAKIDQGGVCMCKNVYIKDDSILGADNAYGTFTWGGLSVNNSAWVLHEVIGV